MREGKWGEGGEGQEGGKEKVRRERTGISESGGERTQRWGGGGGAELGTPLPVGASCVHPTTDLIESDGLWNMNHQPGPSTQAEAPHFRLDLNLDDGPWRLRVVATRSHTQVQGQEGA